jgi:hypothetical protein
MFSADQLNDKIRKVSASLGIQDVNRVRGIVTLERIVARLLTNPFLKEHLVFGGGFVLFKELNTNRYTRDADAVVSGISTEDLIKEISISLTEDLDDGFWFGDIIIQKLETESGYGGIRFNILYKAGAPFPSEEEKQKLRRIHLDISIGVDLEDVALEKRTHSILKSMGPIEWKVYPPEFIASEKIHCLLYRGDRNSRGKDVYDLPLIFEEINDDELLKAIERTFERRNFQISSLYETANAINTGSIKTSYNTVMVENMKNNFEESWQIIINKLKKIDSLRNI